MTIHTVPDGLQSFTAILVFVMVCVVPFYQLFFLYRAPSPFHRRPWRVVLALAVLAVLAPVTGFLLVAALTLVSNLFSGSLFSGDAGMRPLVLLVVAAVLYVLAAIVVALVTLLGAGRRKKRDGGIGGAS